MGEYVYGGLATSHPLDHQALVSQGPKVKAKADAMVRSLGIRKTLC